MTTDVPQGDVLIDGKPYRMLIDSYKVTDIVDFAPRAASPGGSIIHSELGLYQPLLQTEWRHGFGFPWYQDALGYMRTDGSVDTRHPGAAMMHTQPHSSDSDNALKAGGVVFNGNLYTYGSGGLRKFDGASWTAVTCALGGTVAKTNGNVNLVGTSTTWLTDLSIGDTISVPGGGGTDTLTIASVTDNTHAAVSVAPTHTASGQTITLTMARAINFLVATGTYLIICPDGSRIKKMAAGGGITNAGLDANAVDYKWGIIFGGYFYFGQDGSTKIHFSDQEDLNDLEGDTEAASTTIFAGAGGFATLGAKAYAGKLYIIRPDGLWLLENKICTPVLDYSDQASTTNFRTWAEYNGLLTFPIRDRIKQWNGSRVTDITPPQWSDIFPYGTYGRFTGMVKVGDFLYVIGRTNEASWSEDLLCWDGVGWHKLNRLVSASTTDAIVAAFYDVFNNRLWYHYDSATADHTDYIQFQSQSDYPYADFPTSGTHQLVSSRLDMGYRRVRKSMRSLLVEASGIVSGHQALKVYYSIDGATFVLWSTITANGVTELLLPGSFNSVEFYYMQLAVQFTTDDTALTPVLEGLTVKFIMRPQVAYGHSMTIIWGDNLQYGTMKDSRNLMDLRTDLRTARNSAAPIAYVDPHGVSHYAYLSALIEHIQEQNVGESPDGSNSFEAVCQCNLVEV